MKNKKWVIGVFAAVLTAAGSTAAFAASQNASAPESAAWEASASSDWASVPESAAFPADGMSFCSAYEDQDHCYTDADGDGICDHRQDPESCGQHGVNCPDSGSHHASGSGSGGAGSHHSGHHAGGHHGRH